MLGEAGQVFRFRHDINHCISGVPINTPTGRTHGTHVARLNVAMNNKLGVEVGKGSDEAQGIDWQIIGVRIGNVNH